MALHGVSPSGNQGMGESEPIHPKKCRKIPALAFMMWHESVAGLGVRERESDGDGLRETERKRKREREKGMERVKERERMSSL